MRTWIDHDPARKVGPRPVGATLLLALAAAACGTPTSVSSVCIAPAHDLVFVRGTVYAASDPLPATFSPGEEYATVLKLQGCEDMIVLTGDQAEADVDNTLDEGDSNYLPAGTRLYVIPGSDPAETLAVRPAGEGWHAVVRFEGGI